jgi:hypothetical protein
VLNPATSQGLIDVMAVFTDAAGHALGRPAILPVEAGTSDEISVDQVLGGRTRADFGITLIGTGPFVAEAAPFLDESPNQNVRQSSGIVTAGAPTGACYFSDLSTRLVDQSQAVRRVIVFNSGNTPLHLVSTYLASHGVVRIVRHVAQPDSLAVIDVGADLGSAVGTGPVGGELADAQGTTGSFFAWSVGVSLDGRIALEEPGEPR